MIKRKNYSSLLGREINIEDSTDDIAQDIFACAIAAMIILAMVLFTYAGRYGNDLIEGQEEDTNYISTQYLSLKTKNGEAFFFNLNEVPDTLLNRVVLINEDNPMQIQIRKNFAEEIKTLALENVFGRFDDLNIQAEDLCISQFKGQLPEISIDTC